MAKFPTYEEMGEKVAEEALNIQKLIDDADVIIPRRR